MAHQISRQNINRRCDTTMSPSQLWELAIALSAHGAVDCQINVFVIPASASQLA